MKQTAKLNIRNLIAIFVATILLFQQSATLYAQEDRSESTFTEVDRADYVEFAQKVQELREKFGGLSGETHAWDTWRLLDQEVIDERFEQIEARVKEIYENDPDQELKIDDMVDREVKPRHYNSLNLRIQVVGDPQSAVREDANDVRVIREILEKNVKNSLAVGHDNSDLTYVITGDGKAVDYRLQIADKNGKVLHRFTKPISSVALFGNLLVYTDQNAYDATAESVMVRVIDLDYFRPAIGNAQLPVFSFPLKVSGAVHSLKIENGELVINDRRLPYQSMKVLSQYMQILFNVSVAMVDPATQKAAEPLLNELIDYMDLSLSTQEEYFQKSLVDAFGGSAQFRQYLNTTTMTAMARKDIKKLKPVSPEQIKNDPKLESDVRAGLNDEQFKQSLLRTNRNLQLSNRFVARMNAYISRLAAPQPMGSPTIVQSLAMVAAGKLRGEEDLMSSGREGLKNHPRIQFLKKFAKWGSAALAGAIIGSQLPEPYTIHLSQALDLPSFILDQTKDYFQRWNYGWNLVDMSVEGVLTPARSIVEIPNQYFLNGRLPKFMIGLSSVILTPIIYYAVPHTIVNSIKASKYVWKNWREYKDNGNTILAAVKESFIDYARKEQKNYDMALAESEARKSGGEARSLNEDELKKFEEVTADYEQRNTGFVGRQLNKLKSAFLNAKSGLSRTLYATSTRIGVETEIQFAASGAMMALASSLENKKVIHSVDTLGQALKSFLLSFQSVANTDRVLGTIWNYFFISRSFIWYPKMWAMAMLYPKYFRTAVQGNPGSAFMPNEWNGGLRTTWPTIRDAIQIRRGIEDVTALHELEKKMLPLDAIVQEEALYKTVTELIKRSKDPDKIRKIFDSRRLMDPRNTNSQILSSASPTTGITDITDGTLSDLDSDDVMFFRAYYVRIADETMKRVLLKKVDQLDLKSAARPMTPETVKKIVLETKKDIVLEKSPELRAEVQQVMNEIHAEGKTTTWANKVAKGIMYQAQRWALNFRFDTIARLNPKGAQVGRFLIAEKQLKDPNALARAVRDVIAKLVISKPLKLVGMLAFYASIDEGLLKPMYDEQNGPNSINYLSRYLFYTGFAVDTIISIMADTWMKVQKDYRLDKTNAFDKVPMYKDRIKGFWRYYMKNLTKNPNNKWSENHIYYLRLVTSNIPAAMVTAIISHLSTLGRIDIGAVFNGYFGTYMTPTMGLELKAESAFELTSSQHITAQVPKELRASPEAQRWIGKEIQKKRLFFNIAYQLALEVYTTVQEAALWHTIADVGSRSLERMVFHGNTLAEVLARMFRTIGEATNQLPASVDNVVDHAMKACEKLFTNNYTDWSPDIKTTDQFYNK